MKNKILLFTLILTKFILGQNIPPQIISEGNELYCPLSEQTIVTNFDIIDPDDISVDAFYIQISEGYILGEDSLTLTGNHPDVIASWDAVEGKLELLGPPGQSLLYTDIISAVYDVMFFSNNEDVIDKTFSFTIGDANYLESTGHYYEFIPLIDVRWTEAKVLAEGLTYYGLQGYLATLTSEAENQIAAVQTNNFGWIGASDLANEGDWRWVTGPEGLENGGAGRSFWLGNGTALGGAPVNGEYSNWNGTNEPNNAGPEHYAHVTSPNVGGIGTWNDLPDPAAGGGDYQSKGYFVEYGGMPGDPDLELSSSTKLLAPQISINVNFFGCSNDNLSILAESNSESGEVYFYDSLDSPVPIFIGNEFSPDVSGFFDVVTYYITPFPPGICEFPRTEVPVLVFASPIANQPEDLVICNDNLVTNLDFVAPQTQVLAEQDPTEFTVSYHLSQDDADTNSGALSLPYQNTNSSEEIFVRIENNANTACYDTTSFTLTVFEAPVANIVETFEICDDGDDGDDANGQAEVTLTDFDAIVLDTQDSTLFSVSYHLSQGDADANTAALTSPYYNAGAAFTYPVFARIQNNLNTDCYATTEFTVNIYKTPTANLADDIDICDDDNDGVMSFDFVAPQTQVLAEQDPTEFTVSYHLSQDDADTNSGALSLPYQNTNSSEEIFVRIENNANTACYDTTSFTLTVFEAPVANIVETFEICDDGDDGDDANGQAEVTLTDFDAIVLDTQDSTLFSVSYHLSQGDADANTAALTSPYYNAGAAFTYPVFARIQNNLNTDCYATTEFTVNIYKTPTANLADDIDICDDDNDGVMSFDFVAPQTQVLAEQDPTEFTVSYHLSQDDADTNSGALSLPYQNTNSSEEIFVRIENNANTACYDTTSFIINIFNTPVIPQGIQYNLCDYTNPGNLTEVFDLLSLNAEIINGQDVTISHHLSFEDAENGVGAITDPYTNTSPNQVIFVLLENNAYTGCRSIGTYNIIVDPLPDLITNVPLVQCDIDDIQDGISIYNLEEAAENIIIGDDANNYTLSFHLSQEDLDANIGAIADPTNFVNTSPLQTIFTRVENIATTCYSTSFFYLETIFNPIPGDAGLIVCDNSEMNGNDYDGLGLFTLSDANEYILSLIVANPNNDITDADQLDVAYYSSETDALLELGQLPDQYISEVADSQTVFVRIERGNDCFGINTMLLEVIPVPELNEIPDEILCSDNPGIAEVFLTDYDAIVLGSQSANDVIISYHATQQDADLGIGALASPYTVTNQQTIFVREEVQNNDPNQTGCYITNVNFTLTVEPNPSVNIPTPQVLCDDDFDGLQTFDLNGVDIEIIGGQTDMVVSYYTNQNDADSASNPVGDVFQTTQEDTQTLIFRIENITTGCYSTGNLELIVNPLPVLQPLDNFATCDDNVETDNDTSNDSVEFDLLSQNTAVLNGQDPTIFEVSYHLSQIDADQGINALVSPYTNTSNPQTIFTRVRNTLTDCFNTVPLVLQVNPLPVVNLDEDYLLCVNTNGTEILDPLVIYSNLSATDFSFIWSNANGDVLGTDPDFEPIQGGVYNLEVFDALLPTQCAAPVETFIVIESSPPDVTAEVTSEPFASTHVIQSTGTGQGIYEFSLDQGPWGDSGLFVGVKPGEHIVSVRDLNGCGTVSVPLLVIDYPKFFTPNQDGYNDTWNITALENQPNSKIYIFDRYGKFIKQISTSGIGWDGTYNGAQMPSTDYWFKLEYTDLDTGNLKIFKAHFSLKR